MSGFRRMLGSAAGAVDRALVAAMSARERSARQRAAALSHAERLEVLAAVEQAYALGLEDPSVFFRAGASVEPTLREVRPRVFDAEWSSTHVPYLDLVAETYLSRVENRVARARLYLRDGPRSTRRPAVIAVHGYMGGHWILEEAQWPIAWLMRRGLDVALPVLPFHALRAGTRRGAPSFPSSDPRLTNEGFGQAACDIGVLAAYLRTRGAPHVGVIGMSLGGYTSALLATVSDAFDFVMPMIPLASIADFAREQGRLGAGDEATLQHAALERANWVVSPLARPLRLPRTRALVVAAEHDRVTPAAHAKRIATHFGCDLITIPGAHVVQLGRAEAFRGLGTMLEREGIIEPRPARR